MTNIRVMQDGINVVIGYDGKIVFHEPWNRMKELAAAIQIVASKAEEWDKASKIAEQNAILIRSGAPLGLTNHPVIQRESMKLALWDRTLRRFIPNRIRGVFGTPTVKYGS